MNVPGSSSLLRVLMLSDSMREELIQELLKLMLLFWEQPERGEEFYSRPLGLLAEEVRLDLACCIPHPSVLPFPP